MATNHKNDIVVGRASTVFHVTVKGPFNEYVHGIARAVDGEPAVAGVIVDSIPEGNSLQVTIKPLAEGDTLDQVRIRVRNLIRDWIANVTGYLSNFGEDGNYADLYEEVVSGQPVDA